MNIFRINLCIICLIRIISVGNNCGALWTKWFAVFAFVVTMLESVFCFSLSSVRVLLSFREIIHNNSLFFMFYLFGRYSMLRVECVRFFIFFSVRWPQSHLTWNICRQWIEYRWHLYSGFRIPSQDLTEDLPLIKQRILLEPIHFSALKWMIALRFDYNFSICIDIVKYCHSFANWWANRVFA